MCFLFCFGFCFCFTVCDCNRLTLYFLWKSNTDTYAEWKFYLNMSSNWISNVSIWKNVLIHFHFKRRNSFACKQRSAKWDENSFFLFSQFLNYFLKHVRILWFSPHFFFFFHFLIFTISFSNLLFPPQLRLSFFQIWKYYHTSCVSAFSFLLKAANSSYFQGDIMFTKKAKVTNQSGSRKCDASLRDGCKKHG